jgi:hypothetical protein
VSAAKPSKSQPTAAPTPNTSTSSAAASASGADDVLHALHTTTEGVERLRTHTLPSINSHIERQTRVLDAVQTERVVTALELVARGKMQRQFKVTYTCVRVYVHSRRWGSAFCCNRWQLDEFRKEFLRERLGVLRSKLGLLRYQLLEKTYTPDHIQALQRTKSVLFVF